MREVFQIDPINDPRWREFIATCDASSAFHRPEWLIALKLTYGYESFAVTTSAPGVPLANGILVCKIKSWLTGTRLVSVPFADHCTPLVSDESDFELLFTRLRQLAAAMRCKYLELRPLQNLAAPVQQSLGLAPNEEFCFHALDLTQTHDQLFQGLHKSCIRRKLQRAEKESLRSECGRSDLLLNQFYALMTLTRRRHQLPPQPITWFRNLAKAFGDDLQVRVAYKGEQPVASMLTLRHNKTVIYKYGCSDSAHHNLGSMPFLFWECIRAAKESGAEILDFGRSESDNQGLIEFKGHLGGQESRLVYYRNQAQAQAGVQPAKDLSAAIARSAFSYLPDFCLTTVGRLLYKHVG